MSRILLYYEGFVCMRGLEVSALLHVTVLLQYRPIGCWTGPPVTVSTVQDRRKTIIASEDRLSEADWMIIKRWGLAEKLGCARYS
jgi:hypothetical protein